MATLPTVDLRKPEIAVKQIRALMIERAEMIATLEQFVELGEHVPIFQLDDGKSSVKAVRLAGKFMGAMDKARALIAKANHD